MHAAGFREDARLRLELAVGGEGHPVGFEIAARGERRRRVVMVSTAVGKRLGCDVRDTGMDRE